jgi:hypothetical protein
MQAKAMSSNYTPGYKYTTLPRNFQTTAAANNNSPIMQAKAMSSNYTPGYKYTTLPRNFPITAGANTNAPLSQGPANLKDHHDISRYSLAKWKEVAGPYCYTADGTRLTPDCPSKEKMHPPDYAPAAQIPQRNRMMPWSQQVHSWAPGAPPLPKNNVVFTKPKATPSNYLPYFRPVGYPTPGLSKMDSVRGVEGLGPTPPNLPQRNRMLPFQDPSSRVQWKLPNGREGLGPTPPNLPQRNRMLPFQDPSSRVQWKLPNGRESLAPEVPMKQRNRMLPFEQQRKLREGQGKEAIGPAAKFHQVNRMMPWTQRQEEQGPAFRNNPGMSVPPVHNAGQWTPFPNF